MSAPPNITNLKGGVLPLLFVNKLKRKWVRKLSIIPTPRTPSPAPTVDSQSTAPTSLMYDKKKYYRIGYLKMKPGISGFRSAAVEKLV